MTDSKLYLLPEILIQKNIMKKIFSAPVFLGLAFMLTSAITIMEAPQDPPKKKTKKHLKMVKVDEDGKKIELDTIIEGDDIFVWNGDTIDGDKKLKWISKDDFVMDSLHEHLDFDMDFEIKANEDGNVFIMKSKKGKKDHDVMIWHEDDDKNEMILKAPHSSHMPHAAKMVKISKGKKGNLIDLSDPGIISFKKKKLSKGREKITIIRNEVEEQGVELHEEIIIDKNGGPSMMITTPKVAKKVIVKKSGDGEFEVIENEDVWDIREGDEKVKIIKEDGKTIHIKEIKEGDEKKIEVEIEVEEKK